MKHLCQYCLPTSTSDDDTFVHNVRHQALAAMLRGGEKNKPIKRLEDNCSQHKKNNSGRIESELVICISHEFIADYRKTGFIGQKLWQLDLRFYPYCCEPWTYFSLLFNAALINKTQGMASGLARYTPILSQIKWYSMTRMGIRTRYKTAGKFATGAKRCQVCSIFIRSDSRL